MKVHVPNRARKLELLDALAHPGPTVTYDLEATFANGGTFYRNGHRATFVGLEREIEANLRAGARRLFVEVRP